MPIISKKNEVKLNFTNIIINKENDIEIDFEVYDNENKIYVKAIRNKKCLFDWPLDSIKEVLDFIESKLLFNNKQTNDNTDVNIINNKLQEKSNNNTAGGIKDLKIHLDNMIDSNSNYANQSSLISNPSFIGVMGDSKDVVSKQSIDTINRMVSNLNAIEIDLETDISDEE